VTPTQAIESFDQMLAEFDRLRAALAKECAETSADWFNIVYLGPRRDDHAAELLCRLRPYLASIRFMAERCENQITEMHTAQCGSVGAA
jgi:hypothetical protein